MDNIEALLDISEQVLIRETPTCLTLFEDGRLQWSEGARKRCLVLKKDVIGFKTVGSKIRVSSVEEVGGGSCSMPSRGTLVRKHLDFQPLSTESRELWCSKLQRQLDSLCRPKRLFILVNPFGGRRAASKVFDEYVKPLLDDANVELTVRETKHQLHAKEITFSLNLTQYDGIVCVSGDGILVEVINGLLEREDWEAAIKMPIGLIPAGTGNGMIKSLLDSAGYKCSAFNATLSIIRGHRCQVDVATLSQGERRFFSVLMLAWGLVADIDIESEKYRWMGSTRLDIYSIQRVIRLRKYLGQISFVPAPGFEGIGSEAYPQRPGFVEDHGSPDKSQLNRYRGSNINVEDFKWRKICGPFISIWLHNVPWGAEDTLAAPDAKFSDGCLDLIVIRDCPKLELLWLLTGLSTGNHVKSSYVIYMKVKAFVLEPGARVDDESKEGIIDCDGEVISRGKGSYRSEKKGLMAYDRIEVTVDQGLATLFSPL